MIYTSSVIFLSQTCYCCCYYRRKEKKYWECSARGTSRGRCPAMVIQHGNTFNRGRARHTHPPTAGLLATVQLYVKVRQKAAVDVVTSATALVTEALNEVDVVTMPHDNRPNPSTVVCNRPVGSTPLKLIRGLLESVM